MFSTNLGGRLTLGILWPLGTLGLSEKIKRINYVQCQ